MAVNGVSHLDKKKTVVLQIAPETGCLSHDMGPLAAYTFTLRYQQRIC